MSNIVEYENASDPFIADTDSDGISDYDEIFTHATSPSNIDSDYDGLPDDWEIGFGLDPLDGADAKSDTDGDLVDAANEYIAGTSPTNALDAPVILANQMYSFEDNMLPDGWRLADNSMNISFSSVQSTDGNYSLSIESDGALKFNGFFLGADLVLDLHSSCDNSGLAVLVDGVLVYTASVGQNWNTYRAPIPHGHHEVEISFTLPYCGMHLDKVRLEEPLDLEAAYLITSYTELRIYSGEHELLQSLTVPGVERVGHAAVNEDGLIIVVDAQKAALVMYNSKDNTWNRLESYLWKKAIDSAIAVHNQFVYVIDGDGEHRGIVRFNLVDGSSEFFPTLIMSGESQARLFGDLNVSPDGYLYGIGSGGLIRKFDLNSLEILNTVQLDSALDMSFSPDGDVFILARVYLENWTYALQRYNSSFVLEASSELNGNDYADIALVAENSLLVIPGFASANYRPLEVTTTSLQATTPYNINGGYITPFPIN